MRTTDLHELKEDQRQRRAKALAADLYRNGSLSLGSASEASGLSLGEFVAHLGALGVEVAGLDETTGGEAEDVSGWLP